METVGASHVREAPTCSSGGQHPSRREGLHSELIPDCQTARPANGRRDGTPALERAGSFRGTGAAARIERRGAGGAGEWSLSYRGDFAGGAAVVERAYGATSGFGRPAERAGATAPVRTLRRERHALRGGTGQGARSTETRAPPACPLRAWRQRRERNAATPRATAMGGAGLDPHYRLGVLGGERRSTGA